MGKTTDAFAVTMQTLSDQSKDATRDLKVALHEILKLDEEWSNLEKSHNKRTLEIQKENGNDASVYEPIVDKDAEVIRIGKLLDTVGNQLMTTRRDRDKAKAELSKATASLKAEIAKLDKFIKTKTASKNPFKSKKSLPTADSLLKAAGQLLTNNNALL